MREMKETQKRRKQEEKAKKHMQKQKFVLSGARRHHWAQSCAREQHRAGCAVRVAFFGASPIFVRQAAFV